MRAKLRTLYDKYGYFLYFLIVAVYFVLFFTLEKIVDASSDYFVSYLPLDDLIPFCEWFIIPYVLWYPFLCAIGIYLMLYDPDGFRRYILFIGISFYTVVLFCFIFPNGQNLRVDLSSLGRSNIATKILGWIYSADTNTNVLPSMHVVGCFGVVFATFSAPTLKNKPVKVLTVIMAVLISASTVFVKQHSILDGIVAIPYSFIPYLICYKAIRFKKKYEPILSSKNAIGDSKN